MEKLIKSKPNKIALSNGDIESKFESKFCPIHRERPVVTIVNENDISIYGCCVEFEDNCRTEIKKIMKDEALKRQL